MPKHPLADCENCDLNEAGAYTPTKRPVSLGMPSIAVVGEAPGYQEAQRGEPFVGPSGKLLNHVLDYHGIKREEVLLTNAVLCRPQGNQTPSKNAIQCCSKRLLDDLSGIDRVLSLGNTPSQALLQTRKGITSLRIGPRRRGLLIDAEIVPTVHPAYCLRNGDAFPDLIRDIAKLKADPKPWKPPQYVVADDEQTALIMLEQLAAMSPKKVVVDIECGIDKDNSFDHPNKYQMLCVGICYGKGKVLIIGEEAYKSDKVRGALGAFLRSTKVICQNGKFDAAGIYPTLGNVDVWFDTMLAHYVQDERPGGHSLGTLGVELLGTPDWKGELDKYFTAKDRNYALVPRPILYKYNAYDDAVTWDLYELFEQKLDNPVANPDRALPGYKTLRGVHDFLVKAGNELKFLELNGIHIDKDYSTKLSQEYLEILAEMEDELDALAKKDYDPAGGINPRSPKQIREYLYDNDVRVLSTNAETLELIQKKVPKTGDVGKFVSKLLEHRLKAKRHGTYIKGIRSRTYRGRVYTTYLLHGTTSGRLASRNPNLQNIVRDNVIRAQFAVSKPENVFVHCDYKQAEGRVMATEAQDEDLRNLFMSDEDIFDNLGRRLYHLPPDVKPEKEQRIRVKAFFYGIGYGRTAYSLAQEYEWSTSEAEKELAQFKGLIPGVVKWQQNTKQLILDGKDLTTAFGRSRRFMLITKENRDDVLKEGLSFVPQSTASDICLHALIRLRPMLRGRAFIRLTIHDALVAECAEGERERVAEIMSSVMIEEAAKYTTYVPFGVDVSYGKNWGEL